MAQSKVNSTLPVVVQRHEPGSASSIPRMASSVVRHDWPYLSIFVLALIGVAVSAFLDNPLTYFWVALAPAIGALCVFAAWHRQTDQRARLHLLWTQSLHWGAVLIAMHLMFVRDVDGLIDVDGAALSVLCLLALGTFVAGLTTESWRMCVLGGGLALLVPAIAWLEKSVLLLLVAGVAAAALLLFIWTRSRRPAEAGRDLSGSSEMPQFSP